MTNKAPSIITVPGIALPDEAIDLLHDFEDAGLVNGIVYGGYLRDTVAQQLPRDIDVLAFIPSDQIYESADDFAHNLRRDLRRQLGINNDINIERAIHDHKRDNNLARLTFTFNDLQVDLIAIEGEVNVEDAFAAQILGADAPMNGFAAMLDKEGIQCDSRALAHLNQEIFQPSPVRDAAEISARFNRMQQRFPNLQLVEPDYSWEPPVRVTEAAYYDRGRHRNRDLYKPETDVAPVAVTAPQGRRRTFRLY